eukprot:2589501-Prymnesium_polylepis.1
MPQLPFRPRCGGDAAATSSPSRDEAGRGGLSPSRCCGLPAARRAGGSGSGELVDFLRPSSNDLSE